MNFFGSISGTIRNALGTQAGIPPGDTGSDCMEVDMKEDAVEESVKEDIIPELIIEQPTPHMEYTSLSPIDQLMLRAIVQAQHQLSTSANVQEEDEDWTLHIDEIVQTIEFPEEDAFEYNMEVSGSSPVIKADTESEPDDEAEEEEQHDDVEEEDADQEVEEEEAEEENSQFVDNEDSDAENGGDENEEEDPDESDDSIELVEEQSLPMDSTAVGDKYRAQIRQCSQMVKAGWQTDTILAYLKVDRYGYESLFRTTWLWDFSRFPTLLFTHDEQSSFVKALEMNNMKESHATRAFEMFCKVGGDVRLLHQRHTWAGRRPEAYLKKQIKVYLKWAWKDCGLRDDLERKKMPTLLVADHPRLRRDTEGVVQRESTESLEARISQKLEKAGNELLDLLGQKSSTTGRPYLIEPPTLFGFAIVEMMVGVYGYEPTTKTTRSIGFFDFENPVSSTEHSIRIALLLNWAKYSMLKVKSALQAADCWIKDEDMDWKKEEYDPDA